MYFQYFSGQDYFEARKPCDPTQIGRFRTAIGEAGLAEILARTVNTAVALNAITPKELETVIVDTTVQEKAIAHPTDSRLLEIARSKLVQQAKRAGISLKQTFQKEGKQLRFRAGGYAHAKQFKRLKKVVNRQRTIVGKLIREIPRKMAGVSLGINMTFTTLLERAERLVRQQIKDKNKLYALHAPEHGMRRCWLKGAIGDALHSISCALGFNMRWLIRAMVRLGCKPLFALNFLCGYIGDWLKTAWMTRFQSV